jgi:hypothetical protein
VEFGRLAIGFLGYLLNQLASKWLGVCGCGDSRLSIYFARSIFSAIILGLSFFLVDQGVAVVKPQN